MSSKFLLPISLALTSLFTQCDRAELVEVTPLEYLAPQKGLYDSYERMVLRISPTKKSIYPARAEGRYFISHGNHGIGGPFVDESYIDPQSNDLIAIIRPPDGGEVFSSKHSGELDLWYSEQPSRVSTQAISGDKGILHLDGKKFEYEMGTLPSEKIARYGVFFKVPDDVYIISIEFFDEDGKLIETKQTRRLTEGISIRLVNNQAYFEKAKAEIASVKFHYFPESLKNMTLPLTCAVPEKGK